MNTMNRQKMTIQTEKITMCKDDDRVIESLVSQINDLQEELGFVLCEQGEFRLAGGLREQ